jgi:hypothetical protein
VLNGEVWQIFRDSDSNEVPDFCGNGYPQDPAKTLKDKRGCVEVDADTDSHVVPGCDEECLINSNKSLPVRVASEKQRQTLIATVSPRSHQRFAPRLTTSEQE